MSILRLSDDMHKRKLLWREIILALILKLLLLSCLWILCFLHPIDKKLTPNLVGIHLLTAARSDYG